MAVDVNIRIRGMRELQAKLKRFDKDVSQRATANALNRTINKVRTLSIGLAATEMGVRKALFTRGLRYNWRGSNKVGAFKTRRARAGVRMFADMTATGSPHNLIRFGAVQAKSGVMHNAWGKLQFNPSLAVVEANGARFVVVIQTGNKGKGRLGRKAYGPGLAQTLDVPRNAATVQGFADKWFPIFFVDGANKQLARAGYRARL